MQAVHFELLAHGNLVLSSTTFNYCKHVFLISPFSFPTHSPNGYVGGVGGVPSSQFQNFGSFLQSALLRRSSRRVLPDMAGSAALSAPGPQIARRFVDSPKRVGDCPLSMK